MLRIGASSGFENCCWNTIRAVGLGGVKLEKGLADFSRGELLVGHIVNFKGGRDVAGPLGRPGWSWRQRLTQKYWLWMKEW